MTLLSSVSCSSCSSCSADPSPRPSSLLFPSFLPPSASPSPSLSLSPPLPPRLTPPLPRTPSQRALIRPESVLLKGRPLPGKADPVARRHLLYYSDPTKRGYLALEAQRVREAQGEQGEAPRAEQQQAEEAAQSSA